MRSVRFHPAAEDDLAEAIDHYNEEKDGLGASLLQERRPGYWLDRLKTQ